MVMNLEGRTAVITGGGSGIGRGFAFALAKRGANIVVVGRDRDRIEGVASELVRDRGVRAEAFALDVGDHEAVERLAEQVFQRFGAVHVLANNAAISTVGNAWETSLADWEQVIRVNLLGVIYGVRSFVPRMLKSGEPGYVVNVSSMGGLLPVPMKAPYTAAKHGMNGMSKALRAELRAIGAPIRVSVVCPGPVATDMIDAQLRRYANDPKVTSEARAVLDRLKQDVDRGMSAHAAGVAMLEGMDREQFWIFLNARDYYGALEEQHIELRACE